MARISFQWLKKCVEIPVFFLFFSFLICEPVSTNFIIYRTCYVILGFNRTDCEKLGTNNADNYTHKLEELVQPYANVIGMTQLLTGTILPALFCLFIGPWSDKHGRKPVLISCLSGFAIGSIVTIFVVLTPSLSPWYLLLGSIPVVISGGFSPFLMAALSYVTDVTTTESRGMRIGIFEAVLALGTLLGNLSSSYVFNYGGYVTVFGIGSACNFIAFLYTFLVLSETIIHTPGEGSTSLFSLKNIYAMIQTTFKPRQSYTRCILLLTIAIITIFILGSAGDGGVFFLFLREAFKWNLQKYTLFKTLKDFLWIIGTFLGLAILHKLLKIKEGPLVLIGLVAYFISALFQGLATADWYFYAAGAIRSISGLVSPMCRSLISKLTSSDEIGKIFSITITIEALTLVLGAPLYTLVYNSTLDTHPGAFNFITVGIFGIEIILTTILIIIQMTRQTHHDYTALSINT